MKNVKLTSLLLASAMLISTVDVASAKTETTVDRVVAVVNGSVITQQDLNSRFSLLLRQLNKNLPEEHRQAAYQKTLNDLINEEIKRQYAERANITASKNEIDLAISQIERKNGMSHGAFYNMTNGLVETAKDKIEAEIIWNKIVDKKIRPRTIVATGEIDRIIENRISDNEVTEKEVYQIFISTPENVSDKSERRARVNEILSKLNKDGLDFHTLARSFSDDASANEGKGGYLGWFGTGELSPALDEALKEMNKGDISSPIETANGWHILYVANKRTGQAFETERVTEYKLHKAVFDTSESEFPKDELKTFKKFVNDFERLGDLKEFALRNANHTASKGSGEMGWVSEHEMPTNLKSLVEDLDQTEFSRITENGDVYTIYFLEDKREVLPKKLQAFRARISKSMTENRVSLTARRFMRDLRRKAFVDVRL